jgi:hypothetical protein
LRFSSLSTFIVCNLTLVFGIGSCALLPLGDPYLTDDELVYLPGGTLRDQSAKLELYQNQLSGPFFLAALDAHSCLANQGYDKWHFRIQTAFGTHDLSMSVSTDTKQALAEGTHFEKAFALETPYNSDLKKHLCKTWDFKHSGRAFVQTDKVLEFRKQAMKWLNQSVPNCKFLGHRGEHWSCEHKEELGELDFGPSLKKIQRAAMKSFKRQPYIFSRKLALTIMAEKFLLAQAPPKQFCNILRTSLPSELPLAFRGKPFQESICVLEDAEAKALLQTAFFFAKEEVKTLYHVIAKTSAKALLKIRIPKDQLLTKNMRVELKPSQEVLTKLVEALPKNPTTMSPCWHPLFDSNPEHQELAIGLGLTGQDDSCKATQKPGKVLKSYLATATIGESQFVVSNGRAKILYLPKGAYSYSLKSLPDPALQLGQSSSSGFLKWLPGRKVASIQVW